MIVNFGAISKVGVLPQTLAVTVSCGVIFFEIHNRILFKIKALRLTHNTHTTTLKRSKPARKHTHPPPHHTYQRTPHTKQSHLQKRKERAAPTQRPHPARVW